MNSADLVRLNFSAPVPFRRSEIPQQWVQQLPDTRFGVIAVLSPTPIQCDRGESDIAYVSGVLHRGGVKAAIEEYLRTDFRKGNPGAKRTELFCGKTSYYRVTYLWLKDRSDAKAKVAAMLAQYKKDHGRNVPDAPRRTVLPRRTLRKVVRVMPESLGAARLVYVIVADRPVAYEKGKSRIVYIGVTKNGLARVAESAAENAERIFRKYRLGIKCFDVFIVSPARVPDLATHAELETAFLRAFELVYGASRANPPCGPLCNDHNSGKASNAVVFKHFKEQAVRRKVIELSNLPVNSAE